MKGVLYYSKVYAVDRATLQSDVVDSVGFIVDTTPPVPRTRNIDPNNLLQNPSFEAVDGGGSAVTTLTDIPADPDAKPDSWTVSSGSACAVVQTGDGSAQDGASFVALKGKMSQVFSTNAEENYQVTFYVSYMPNSQTPLQKQEVVIEIFNGDNVVVREVFQLYSRPIDADSSSISWMFHRFEFFTDATSFTIALESVGESNGIVFDNVKVRILFS